MFRASKISFLEQLNKELERFFLKSWWVLLFVLICYMLYERGMRKRSSDFAFLQNQLDQLQMEKQNALLEQEKLIMQTNSQSDQAYVELTLMKGLGLVPEGQTKIYFYQKEGRKPPKIEGRGNS